MRCGAKRTHSLCLICYRIADHQARGPSLSTKSSVGLGGIACRMPPVMPPVLARFSGMLSVRYRTRSDHAMMAAKVRLWHKADVAVLLSASRVV